MAANAGVHERASSTAAKRVGPVVMRPPRVGHEVIRLIPHVRCDEALIECVGPDRDGRRGLAAKNEDIAYAGSICGSAACPNRSSV
jgi:hypothetical protein